MTTNERIEMLKTTCNHASGKQIVSPEMLEWLDENRFFMAPASTKFHCAYEGGLFDHSYKVMEALLKMTRFMPLRWEREESPYIVGMFHDLCKVDSYEKAKEARQAEVYREAMGYPPVFVKSDKQILKGHGEKSVMLLSQFMTLTEEEICCIRYHMGIFTEDYEWNDFTRAVRKYPNVLWTRHADMYATNVLEEQL